MISGSTRGPLVLALPVCARQLVCILPHSFLYAHRSHHRLTASLIISHTCPIALTESSIATIIDSHRIVHHRIIHALSLRFAALLELIHDGRVDLCR